LYYLGDYEPEALGPVVALAKESRTFLDIGSQAGVYSMIVAAANPNIHVFAFEGDPESVAIVMDNVCRNADRPEVGSVQVCAVVVDDKPGVAGFHLAGGNSSLNPTFRPNTQEMFSPALSIDAFLEAVHYSGPIDLVKIDTESTEPAVLRGMHRTIELWRPVIAIEVLHGRTETDLDRFLTEADYRALWLRRDGPVIVDAVIGDSAHTDLNYLFVPKEKCGEVLPLLGLGSLLA
jgi:FkbM family methyltransferase